MLLTKRYEYCIAMCYTANLGSVIFLRLCLMRLGLQFCERQFVGSTDSEILCRYEFE